MCVHDNYTLALKTYVDPKASPEEYFVESTEAKRIDVLILIYKYKYREL